MEKEPSKNVLGGDLIPCSMDPVTGFFRNGSCDTCAEDRGSHTVCAIMDKEFLMLPNILEMISLPHAQNTDFKG